MAYFWRNIETCALKVFKCERLFVNSTALNLSHVAILMMTISFLKCAFFRTLNFLMYITCSLNSILNAKMHGPCREHNPQRNFTGPVTAPSRCRRGRSQGWSMPCHYVPGMRRTLRRVNKKETDGGSRLPADPGHHALAKEGLVVSCRG